MREQRDLRHRDTIPNWFLWVFPVGPLLALLAAVALPLDRINFPSWLGAALGVAYLAVVFGLLTWFDFRASSQGSRTGQPSDNEVQR